jgi:hypothetical protein
MKKKKNLDVEINIFFYNYIFNCFLFLPSFIKGIHDIMT